MTDTPTGSAPFDFDELHRAIDRLRAKQIFFIGGAAKSGTTWLRLLLNAHPGISCGGEGHFMNRLLPSLTRTLAAYNKTITGKNRSLFADLEPQPLFLNRHMFYLVAAGVSLMLDRASKARDTPIVGEKTPDNVRSFHALSVLFRDAKFIHIVRDARDCTVSAWFHNLRVNPDQTRKNFVNFEAFAMHYARVWVAQVSRGMEFAAAYPARCRLVRFEDLCDSPLESFGPICTFLGAEADREILAACHATAGFRALSGSRNRGEEDRGSFFRRGVHGDWRHHFDQDIERAFRLKAEPWMSSLGYESPFET